MTTRRLHHFSYRPPSGGKTAALGFIAQQVISVVPDYGDKPSGTTVILPLADFRRESRAHPAGQLTLDKYGITEEAFLTRLIENYNELNDYETRLAFLESVLIDVGTGNLDYEEISDDLQQLDELAQSFAIAVDRYLVHQGISLTHSTHVMQARRFIGDGVVVSIAPNTEE